MELWKTCGRFLSLGIGDFVVQNFSGMRNSSDYYNKSMVLLYTLLIPNNSTTKTRRCKIQARDKGFRPRQVKRKEKIDKLRFSTRISKYSQTSDAILLQSRRSSTSELEMCRGHP